MSEVKRFDPVVLGRGYEASADMEESGYGSFVRYEDFLRLEDEVKNLLDERRLTRWVLVDEKERRSQRMDENARLRDLVRRSLPFLELIGMSEGRRFMYKEAEWWDELNTLRAALKEVQP